MMRYVLHIIITFSIIIAGVLFGFIAKAYFNENNISKSSFEENIGEQLQLRLSSSEHETIIRKESLAHKTESYIKWVSFSDKFLGQYRNYTNQFAMSLKWLQTDNYVALQYNNIIVVDFNGDFVLDYKIVIPNKKFIFFAGEWHAATSDEEISKTVTAATGEKMFFNGTTWVIDNRADNGEI